MWEEVHCEVCSCPRFTEIKAFVGLMQITFKDNLESCDNCGTVRVIPDPKTKKD